MSVIIRLQNLPWSANALDIRQFFHGLSIPEGGVHIVGGEQGDAFIAFSTDEDARQAMMNTGGKIKEIQVSLLLSSRTEMQKVIDTARQKVLGAQASQSFTPTTPQVQAAHQTSTPPQPGIPSIPQQQSAQLGVLPPIAQLVAAQRMLPMLGLSLPQLQLSQNQPQLPHHQQQLQAQQGSQLHHQGAHMANQGLHLPNQVPHMPNQGPHLANHQGLHMGNQGQHQGNQGPHLGNQGPHLGNQGPHLGNQGPHLGNQGPHLGNQGPHLGNQGPHLGNQGPHMANQGHHMPNQNLQMQHQQQMHRQQNMLHNNQNNNNNAANQRRPSREDRTERRRSRSRDRKRSRDRSDRRSNELGRGGRKRRSRSRSRDKDRNRRRDRSRSKSRDRDRNRDRSDRSRREKDDRSKSVKSEKGSSSKEEESNGSVSAISPTNSQPTPWANANNAVGGINSRGAMNQGVPKFPPFQQQSVQGDNPVWGQHAFNPMQAQGSQQGSFQGPNNNGPAQFENVHSRIQRPQDTCIEICDLPPNTVYRDIREYFQNQHVLNIKLLCDEHGQKTGRAFIKFGTSESKNQAIQMAGANFKGNLRFEVKSCSEVDYDRALDSYQPGVEQAVVAITNVPPYANEMDVKRVFHGARIFNIVLTHPGENKSIPSAFVQFSIPSEKMRAIAASGKLKIDNQEIFVTESSFEDIFRAQKALKKQGREDEKRLLPIVKDDGPVVSECILLQGLPSSVNNREILDFFSDIGLIPLHIHIMQNESGMPMGDAFCEFRNPIEGARALAKNKALLGNNEIKAKAITRQDMEMTLNMPKKMLPQQMTPHQQMPGMMPRNGQDQMRHQMRPPHFMGRPPFDPRNPFMRGPFPRGPVPPHMMGMRQRPPFPGPGMNGPPPSTDTPVDFGKPGCVIEVTNVPYQADIDEILNFFSEYELTRQNVIRRFNDMGKPTGDVRVSFSTPQEAQRALTIKYKKIRDRQIFLNLLS